MSMLPSPGAPHPHLPHSRAQSLCEGQRDGGWGQTPARMSHSPEQVQHEEGQGIPVGWGQLAHHMAQGCVTGSIIRDVWQCQGAVLGEKQSLPPPSPQDPLLTSSPQEGRVEAEGDQWLLESPQKILEHPTHHMDVSHAAEGGQRAPSPQQLPLPLPHQLLRTWHPVQPCLGHREKGSVPGNHSTATSPILAPTSVKPRVSTSVTHCTTSAGTRGGVDGAKSASTPWGEQCQRCAHHPAL